MSDCGDEVAVTAPVGAERQVEIDVRDSRHSPALLGRGTSSPLQFGQTCSIPAAHATQNVHSYEQITAGAFDFSAVPQRSHTGRISSAMAYLFSWSRLSTARNASWGTSTAPTCFIRFLPFFCCSSSFRFRLMSPP
jgi:hypothetical protein